jgi:hypothetical protein
VSVRMRVTLLAIQSAVVNINKCEIRQSEEKDYKENRSRVYKELTVNDGELVG